MEERNEEISEAPDVKDYGVVVYDEVRLEVALSAILPSIDVVSSYIDKGYKLNNIFVKGNEDIGTQGQAIFVLRKIPDKTDRLRYCKRCELDTYDPFCPVGHITYFKTQ